jgi:hypothetical protein
MERNGAFRQDHEAYSRSISRLSVALDAYLTAERSLVALGKEIESAASEYFFMSNVLSVWLADAGQDAEEAAARQAMIGIDMLLMRQSALLAWYTGETDDQRDEAVTPGLGDAERAELQPGVRAEAEYWLSVIEGTPPPTIVGASGDPPPDVPRTVKPAVDEILGTGGEDLQGIVVLGAGAILGEIASRALEFWNSTAPQVDSLLKQRSLRWVAAKAIEAARDKLHLLLEKAANWAPEAVRELANVVGKAVLKRGLTLALGRVLDTGIVIEASDRRLKLVTDEQAVRGLLDVQTVTSTYKQSRGWMPRAIDGARVISFVPLPGKRYFLLLGAFVLATLSTWAVAAHVGSPKLPSNLAFGIRSVRSSVTALPLSASERGKQRDLETAKQLKYYYDFVWLVRNGFVPAQHFDEHFGPGAWEAHLSGEKERGS